MIDYKSTKHCCFLQHRLLQVRDYAWQPRPSSGFLVMQMISDRAKELSQMQVNELRAMRKAAGVPRIVLADTAGVSAFRLYRAEAGRCELTTEERAAIDRVLAPELARMVGIAADFQRSTGYLDPFYSSPVVVERCDLALHISPMSASWAAL